MRYLLRLRVPAALAALSTALFLVAPVHAAPALDVQVLDACGSITVSGYYTVATDLHVDSGDCFTIAVPDVTLDLGGSAIDGGAAPGSAGIRVLPAATSAQLQHGSISAFATGIEIDAADATVTRITLQNNGTGIQLYQADGATVERNVVTQSGLYGVAVQDSSQITVAGNRIDGSGVYGAWLRSTTHSLIARNAIDGSGVSGVYLGCSPNGASGVLDCQPSLDNIVGRNTVTNSGSSNIAVDAGSTQNMLLENTTSGAGSIDLVDANDGCAENRWLFNTFMTISQSCTQ
ncbi:MAG TPA: right-handed parallel beta-helix repeat-containing protein [Dehalococcoidia bacterium]|nr:right-handed parallel beta-helix repeat-containing protein [Dehalococcoidia bacterium]